MSRKIKKIKLLYLWIMHLIQITKIWIVGLLCSQLILCATSVTTNRIESQLADAKLKHEYILDMHKALETLNSAANPPQLIVSIQAKFPNKLSHSDITELRKILNAMNTKSQSLSLLNKTIHKADDLFSIEECVALHKEHLDFLKVLLQNEKLPVTTKDKYGWKGNNAFEGVYLTCSDITKRSDLIRTLGELTGKIFTVNTTNNIIESSGSGMLVPISEDEQTKFVLRTCKHNFKAPQGYEYYFVQSKLLNPETGEITQINHDEEVEFLRTTSNKVLKINIPQSTVPTRLKNFQGRDITIDKLANDENFQDEIVDYELTTDQSKTIELDSSIKKNYIITSKENINNTRYYAVGYPLYLDRKTPLVITSSYKTPQHDVNGILPEHYAPTSAGMSGGPIFYFNEEKDAIFLIGIITNGKFNRNYMRSYR